MFGIQTPAGIAIVVLITLVIIAFVHNAILTKQINKANRSIGFWKQHWEEADDALIETESKNSVREQVIVRYEERIQDLEELLDNHGIEHKDIEEETLDER